MDTNIPKKPTARGQSKTFASGALSIAVSVGMRSRATAANKVPMNIKIAIIQIEKMEYHRQIAARKQGPHPEKTKHTNNGETEKYIY